MGAASGSRAFRRLILGRGLLVVAMLAAVVGVVGVRGLQHLIAERAERGAELSARLVTSLTVRRNLVMDAKGMPSLGPSARADMDADVGELERRGDISGLEVWAADGRLMYADPGHPPDEQTMPADELALALEGAPFTLESEDEGRGHATVDVFLPVDVQDDGTVDLVVESLLPRDPVNDEITRSTRWLYGGATLVALLAVAWLVRLRRRHLAHEHAATHDPLTGLGNRTLLTDRTESVLSAAQDGKTALLLIDLDGFKEVNDVLGHHVGDELLVAVGRALPTGCRDSDTVVRLGGDEFAVLIAALPNSSAAIETARHLLVKLREPVTIGGVTVEADASIGIALAPDHGDDLTALLRCADVAMYQAKRKGSDIAVYDLDTDPHEAQQLNLLAELRRAIPNGELQLYYQPKSPIAGPVTEVEALIRWNHPRRGLLAPAAFLPLAERTSLIKPITHWVLHEAARQCAVWRAEGLTLRVAVNVSPRNLLDDDLPATVLDAAAAAGISASQLEIEITETAVMADPQRVKNIVERLHSMGVLVAIDDFGAGYTSLSYLKTLAAKCLKIDRAFITHLLNHSADEAVVRNVIHLAHDLGMSTVAEGVETQAVWAKLSELGCDEIQGYVLTPPLPAEEIVEWLADHAATGIGQPVPVPS
jgi:diguanylate cyclase (GGDEF)-like protein